MQRLTELQRTFSRGTARVTHPAGTHAATTYPRKTLASSPEVAASQPTLPRVLSPQHSSFLEAGLVATQRLRMAQNHCHGSWSHGVPASWDSVWLSGALGTLGRRLQFGSLELLVFLEDAFSHKMWKMDRDYQAKTSVEPFYLYNDELVS
jgi:hypothetical protein